MKTWKKGAIVGAMTGIVMGLLISLYFYIAQMQRGLSYMGYREVMIFLVLFTLIGAVIGFWISWLEPKPWKIGATAGAIWGFVSWLISSYLSWLSTSVLDNILIKILMFPTTLVEKSIPRVGNEYDILLFFFGLMLPLIQIIVLIPIGTLIGASFGYIIDKRKSKVDEGEIE